jgi:3D (Asp-Asp-Asp) domain-containing protein
MSPHRRRVRAAFRRKGDPAPVLRSTTAAFVAIALVHTGVVQMPFSRNELRHPPVIVSSETVLAPVIVRGERPRPLSLLPLEARLFRWLEHTNRAPEGKAIRVSLTQYCLRGTTRRGRQVRPGIVAADPRVFPLARHVELFLGSQYLGRFIVDDTGKNVLGNTLDIWTPNCREARRFGRQWGQAMLVARETQRQSRVTDSQTPVVSSQPPDISGPPPLTGEASLISSQSPVSGSQSPAIDNH